MEKQLHLILISFFICATIPLKAQDQNINNYKLNGFTVSYSGVETPYDIAALFALPGDKIKFKANSKDPEKEFIFISSGGTSYPTGKNTWVWELPDSTGHYSVKIIETTKKETFLLNGFIMFPYTEVSGSSINEFQVGNYPNSEKEMYKKPEGFIEITPEMIELYLSPHFQVKDFLCKQKCNYPMYLVLKEELLIKLEKIFETLVKKGYDVTNIAVMSGYRTPYYNKAIGNVQFSRHQFGDAADIYVDNDDNNYMDDLNKDGRSDSKDVEVLHNVILSMTKEDWYKPFIGGLGFYKPNSIRTGFVHVDVRGNPARWGH